VILFYQYNIEVGNREIQSSFKERSHSL